MTVDAGGAALGAAFGALLSVLWDVKEKNTMFKPLLGDINSTLGTLEPLMKEIEKYYKELDRSKEELQNFEKQMRNGAKLVGKCAKTRWWSVYQKWKYSNKLLDLEKSLTKLLNMLSVLKLRDGLQTLVKVNNIGEGVEEIKVSVAKLEKKESTVVVVQNQIQGWCAVLEPPPVTVGLDVPLMEVKNKLLKDDGVSMLVVTAPGGCGKTTLATKFCQDEEVKDKFKNNILFVTVSKEANLDLVVQELYQRMDSQVPTFHSEAKAVQWLQQFFKEAGQNPLLLVLDDVWSGSESLLQKFDELKMPNTKILVTSRSEFRGFGSPYYLKSLDDKDAMTLFYHSASLGDKSSFVPEDIRRKVVERCKGFPLAITVIGSSLRGQPTEIWQQRVVEWSKGSILDSETDLFVRLQSSLDALEKEKAILKECFLDLGSFPEDQRIPATSLIDMWAESYDLAEDNLCIGNLYNLTNRSLANLILTRKEKAEVDGYYSEHFVTQHDMLRELAIYHTKLDPIEDRKRLIIDLSVDNPPKRWREQQDHPMKARLLSISTAGEFSTKWQNMQLPEAEVLVLNLKTKNYALPEFVVRMNNLRVLIVTHYGFLPAELSNFEFLGSLSNLRRIRLERISIPSITKNPRKLESLQKISLFMCNIGQAFSNCSVKLSDALPNLEEMNIDYCNDLVELPTELCNLICLKKLSITHCHKLSALPEDIGKLYNLEVLRLRSCTDLVKLPGSIKNLTKLLFLDISDCFSIKELPEEIGGLSSLIRLNMRQCSRLQELPLSVLDLEKLEEVICDEETKNLWEPFEHNLGNIRIKVAKENINLNWLHKRGV